MTFLEIEAFLNIVQYGSFSAAAEKLYVTQPALGRRIRALEEELGYKTTVIATGGIARFVIPMCRRKMIYDKDLLLKGLRILYENNKKQRDR